MDAAGKIFRTDSEDLLQLFGPSGGCSLFVAYCEQGHYELKAVTFTLTLWRREARAAALVLLLLGSQNGLNAPDSTLDHDFKHWFIHTTIFSGKSYSGNIALNSYFSDFVVSYY